MTDAATSMQLSLDAARAAILAGRLAEAETRSLACLDTDANQPDALYLLGLVRFASGRGEEALRLMERAVQANPRLMPAWAELGGMLVTMARPVEAESRLRAAAAIDPRNIDVKVNLGNALHAQGNLAAAEAVYREALALDQGHVRGNLSLGNLLRQLRRPDEALEFLSRASALAPGSAAAHQFLGSALRDLGRIDEALAALGRALAIDPANTEANEVTGLILKAQDRPGDALAFLLRAGTHYARAQALDCLLRLGRQDEFFDTIMAHREDEATNLHSASLSAYAAYHLGRPDPHPFCPDPLSQVRVVDRYTRPGADADFLRELIAEAGSLHAEWEPRGVTTMKGFQTGGNLFAHGLPALARLSREVGEELLRYRAALLPANMALATRWPMKLQLRGWFVRLLTGGHQYFHNHPFGWMSGCLYLQMPRAAPPGEGAIEFGLESGSYPRLSGKPPPTLLHNPRPGQIALFPSSLYHRTIPFSSDEERLCIAFDLLPG